VNIFHVCNPFQWHSRYSQKSDGTKVREAQKHLISFYSENENSKQKGWSQYTDTSKLKLSLQTVRTRGWYAAVPNLHRNTFVTARKQNFWGKTAVEHMTANTAGQHKSHHHLFYRWDMKRKWRRSTMMYLTCIHQVPWISLLRCFLLPPHSNLYFRTISFDAK